MKKENEFIINLMMCRHNNESVKSVKKLISDDLNWEYISYQIIMNRIAALIVENLLYCEIVFDIPKSILIYLLDSYTSIQHRFDNYKNELKVISTALKEKNIEYVTIKGIHLSLTLYTHFRMNPRDFADIDIVVKKQDLEQLGKVLMGLGYEHARVNYYTNEMEQISRGEILNGKMFYHQIPPYEKKFKQYFIGRDTYKVDANYTIFEGGQHDDPILVSELLKSRVLQSHEGLTYYSLKPEHDLIQLCFHFYKDIMYPPKNERKDVYKLINFYDIYLFINKYRKILDYNYLLGLCLNNEKLKNSLYIVLTLTERVFGDLQIGNFINKLNIIIPEYLESIFLSDIEKIVFENKKYE